MPRNVDAVALVFIVAFVLFFGFVADHGPWCFANGVRVGVVDDHGIRVIAPPAPPALPRLPVLPQLPKL